MKSLVLKNKKLVSIGLAVLAVLFLILTISNLTSTERKAWQSMYDVNYEMQETYIEYAERYEEIGYSSNAQEMYSKARGFDEKIDRYGSELSSLNVLAGIYIVLMIGSVVGVLLVFKLKDDSENLVEAQNETGSDAV